MNGIKRRSPIVVDKKAVETTMQGDWSVVRVYEDEGKGPFLIDLCHMKRWDLQDGDLDRLKPFGMTMPDVPGRSLIENDVLISRMNRTQASIWHLNGDSNSAPKDPAFTDTTDATVFLALLGKDVLSIAEKLCALDLSDPEKTDPCLFQGPLNRVPCQIVMIDRFSENACLLLTCARGYARNMVHDILEAGREFELEFAGKSVFRNWMKNRR